MKHFIVIFLFSIALGLSAQDHFIGVKGIAGLTNVTELAVDNKPILSPSYGITYDYYIKPKIIISAEAILAGRGFRNEILETNQLGQPIRTVYIDNKFQYLTLPLKFGYVLKEESNLFVKVGLAPSVLLKSKTKISGGLTEQTYNAANVYNVQQVFNLFTMAEVGINIKSYERSAIYSSLGAFYGLSSAFSTVTIRPMDANHYGFEASIGYRKRI